jgi:hypothetical protein
VNTPPSRPAAEPADVSAIRIGALVPLTPPGWVEAGRHLLAGLELAVADVNDAGGIGGRPLELVVRDTAADPQRAAAAVDELAGLGVAALAGEYHSVVARAAAARADAVGLPGAGPGRRVGSGRAGLPPDPPHRLRPTIRPPVLGGARPVLARPARLTESADREDDPKFTADGSRD